ncbi:MAG: DegT/DnrJ/EryC1/StrS family aminotransferase [Gemmataceae bacterium]
MTALATRKPTFFDWPLMRNNISRRDLDAVIEFLRQDDPILTQGPLVRAFEQEWSAWLGVRHSVFVNSGSSANLITLAALRERFGPGEVIVPPLTWSSDIASVLHAGHEPVFVDIDPHTLGMDANQVRAMLSPRTRAVFLTHVLGFNALTRDLLDELERRHIPLIEDVCESHGATFEGRKLGSFGLMSNFSFYYAHHLSTIEGGMVCTHDPELYQILRMLRGHGLLREASDAELRGRCAAEHGDLHPEFIFMLPGYNVRGTEMHALIGRSQLPHLADNIRARNDNLRLFLDRLEPRFYFTEFRLAGCSNYALPLILRHPDAVLCRRIADSLRQRGVEFRRGTSGGGNQLRQPYVQRLDLNAAPQDFPRVEHVHFHGFYLGNYPTLAADKIVALCRHLNDLAEEHHVCG